MALGAVRRSQIVTSYGPGSLIPVDDRSYMVLGIDRWDDDAELELREPRLARHLNVTRFMTPPASDDLDRGRDIPVRMFPRLHACSGCRRLDTYVKLADTTGACRHCGERLITSRFIAVCRAGHVSEFPYHRWAHGRDGSTPPRDGHNLSLQSLGQGASLADIVVKCSCGSSNSMRGALGATALQGNRCFGDRPWLFDQDESCDEQPRGVQRGASNVWQSAGASTISIPPWSESASRIVDQYWGLIGSMPIEHLEAPLSKLAAERAVPGGVATLLEAVRRRHDLLTGEPPTITDLRSDEWHTMIHGRPEGGQRQDFVCIPPDRSERIPPPIAAVREVTRLREVRALTGFVRLQRSDAAGGTVAPLSAKRLDWLPAIEVSGEGVFLSIEGEQLTTWEARADVQAHIRRLGGATDSYGRDLPADFVPSPRRVLTHSLAHALIDQWSLDSGYPASSLRERLYVSGDMAGLLIYTATSDSAGSLGGVVSMVRNGRFATSLIEALRRATWCSNDPLCLESGATGVDARNLGACHSCLLLPETSCELSNTLLDRGVLVGADGCPGFFAELVNE